jgi:hypothetical protein
MSCTAVLGFPGGAHAALFASFEAAEHQELVVVCADRVVRLERPFTPPGPDDQYRLMVEAFCEAARTGAPAPLPLESSIANMTLLDRIRDAAG